MVWVSTVQMDEFLGVHELREAGLTVQVWCLGFGPDLGLLSGLWAMFSKGEVGHGLTALSVRIKTHNSVALYCLGGSAVS